MIDTITIFSGMMSHEYEKRTLVNLIFTHLFTNS